jgi:hypothetical protein
MLSMLDKKICAQCYQKRFWIAWSRFLDDWEKRGMVNCPSDDLELATVECDTRKQPPDSCPYLLEQVVNA